MQIVEHGDERSPSFDDAAEHLDERFVDQESLGLWIVEHGWSRRCSRQLGDEPRQIGGSRPVRLERWIGLDERTHGFDEGLVGSRYLGR